MEQECPETPVSVVLNVHIMALILWVATCVLTYIITLFGTCIAWFIDYVKRYHIL